MTEVAALAGGHSTSGRAPVGCSVNAALVALAGGAMLETLMAECHCETYLHCHKLAQAFAVFAGEVVPAEFKDYMVGGMAHVSQVAGHGKDMGHFKYHEGKILDDNVDDGIAISNRNILDLAEAYPKCFDWVIQGL